jgi:hypothetical protein
MYRRFIFYSSGLNSVSPEVGLWWPGKVINLFKQFPNDALHYGADAQQTCADFLVACVALKHEKVLPTEVTNLPLRWEDQEQLTAEFDTPAYAQQWRAWLFGEIERLCSEITDPNELPILIQMDPPFHVTQGGTVLFQRHSGRDYQEGDPLWLTPVQAAKLAKSKEAAKKRRPKPTGMSVDEFETLLRDRLTAAGFEFTSPDHAVARRVVLACGQEPVACEQSFLYYEARDDGIEFGRWFQHQPAKHERVAIRFSNPKLRGHAFESAMGMCGGAPDDARTFARMLRDAFTSGPDKLVSKWRAELRRYEPR